MNNNKKQKPPFDYSFNTSLADLLIDPKTLWNNIIDAKIIHGGKNGCHKFIKIKKNKTELTFKCECGAFMVYPPRKDRGNSHMAVFISKDDYNERRKSK